MRLLLILLAILLAPRALAENQVQSYFQDLQALRTNFVQRVYDERGRVLQSSSGQMLMRRPGQFRWDYRSPNPQIIVADGQRLWAYDVDLEQVTVRKLDNAVSATPLALLSSAAPIADTFKVGAVQRRDGLDWYELTPQREQAEFRVLRVAFKGSVLVSLELEDRFGQRTRLDFQNLERNPRLDPALLQFKVPPGVDVVGDVDGSF